LSELNLILLGPPGAGKGTQADRLKEDFGLAYIGTGDLLRNHKAAATPLGLRSLSSPGRAQQDEVQLAHRRAERVSVPAP
jgi:adenylate kinase family enzyme